MKKITTIVLTITMLIFVMVSLSAAGQQEGSKPNVMSFGTGSLGGTDNVVLEAMSSVVNKKTDLKTSTVTTTGGAEIIKLLQSGTLQGGYSGTIDLVNALKGEGLFDEPVPQENMLQGFGFVTWALPIIVLEGSDIETYQDLEGKHVGFPPAASSSTLVLNMVFEAYDLTDNVNIDYFTWSEGFKALNDRRVDAFVGVYANDDPISGIVEIESRTPIRVLPMDKEIGEKVSDMNAGVGMEELTNEHCKTIPQGEIYYAPSNSGVVVFNSNVSEDDVYTYTQAVLNNLTELKGISRYFDKFEDVCVDVCVETVPFHPGAAKALKEAGLWQDRFTVYSK